jgi:hypothetical protein
MTLLPEYVCQLAAVLHADTDDFTALTQIAHLDPTKSFRGADLRGINLHRANLSGYDFSGANLTGANLARARTHGMVWDRDTIWPKGWRPKPPSDFDLRTVHAMLSRGQEIMDEWRLFVTALDFSSDDKNKYLSDIKSDKEDKIDDNRFNLKELQKHLSMPELEYLSTTESVRRSLIRDLEVEPTNIKHDFEKVRKDFLINIQEKRLEIVAGAAGAGKTRAIIDILHNHIDSVNVTNSKLQAALKRIILLWSVVATIDEAMKKGMKLLPYYRNLTDFSIRMTNIGDLTSIGEIVQLWTLDLRGSTFENLAPISKLRNLRVLRLDGTHTSDLSPLADLNNLTELYLNDTSVTDIRPIIGLQKLRILELEGTEFGNRKERREEEPRQVTS